MSWSSALGPLQRCVPLRHLFAPCPCTVMCHGLASRVQQNNCTWSCMAFSWPPAAKPAVLAPTRARECTTSIALASCVQDRLQKYRGLKSFRASPWDAGDGVPHHFSRLFAFENFARAKKLTAQAVVKARAVRHPTSCTSLMCTAVLRLQAGRAAMSICGSSALSDSACQRTLCCLRFDILSVCARGLVWASLRAGHWCVQGQGDHLVSVGTHVRVTLADVPGDAASAVCDRVGSFLLGCAPPLTAFGLLRHECKLSVANLSVTPCSSYDESEPVANKQRLCFVTGLRTFYAQPVLSTDEYHADKFKMERFMHEGRPCMMSMVAPIAFGPLPALVLRPVCPAAALPAHRLCASALRRRCTASRAMPWLPAAII